VSRYVMRVCREGVVCCSPSSITPNDTSWRRACIDVPYIYFVICAPVASCDFAFSNSITLPIYSGIRLAVKILLLYLYVHGIPLLDPVTVIIMHIGGVVRNVQLKRIHFWKTFSRLYAASRINVYIISYYIKFLQHMVSIILYR